MKRWLKWTLGTVGVLAGVVLVGAAVGWQMAQSKMARKVDIKPYPIAYSEDPHALARGKYLFDSRGCVDCHGANGGGRLFVSEGALRIAGPNITSGGVTASYKPEDWERAIRHGVNPGGRPLMVMPSEDYNRFTDADLSAVVSYIRKLPAQQGGEAVVQLPVPARILYGFGAIQDAAAKIDHTLAPQQPVEEGVTAKHGAYVANMCIGCHGEHLSGGKIPGGPPGWPPAANITPGEGTMMARYKDPAAFAAMMRTGKRPDGSAIQVMPFESLSKMSDVDVNALHAYLQTVAPRPFGQR